MLMCQVAHAFERLESTTRRGEMTTMLADLFKQTPAREIDRLIYLFRGRLGPPFEAPDFGVAERLILVALSDAVGLPLEQVEGVYKKKGDLGLVVEELLPRERGTLTLSEVYDALWQVAAATGAGAQERKVGLVSDLIKRSGGREAKYILRVLQGRLRLGVGDATIMDGLAQAAGEESDLRRRIERSYNLCSDLGFIARTLFTDGPAALERIEPQVDKPIRAALAERLPSPVEVIDKLGRVEVEPKYDGVRLQLHKNDGRVRFFTRRLEDVTGMFPELAEAARRQIAAERAILDGEAVVYNPETGEYLPFQVTARRRRKYDIAEMETRYPVRYFAFDILSADDRDLTREPLLTRREWLEKAVRWQPDDPIEVTESLITDDAAELERFFQDQIQRGLEGAMVKRPDSTYQAGQRNFNWIKLKRAYRGELRDTVDVVIVGYLTGKGKRARFGIGSLLAAVYDPKNDRFRTVTKIGSGLTEAGWTDMRRALDERRSEEKPAGVDSLIVPDVWVEPAIVVEVLADEITRSPLHTCGKVGKDHGYALRFPRVVSIRSDKAPTDATTEQEIREMYRMQQTRPAGEAGGAPLGQPAA